MTNLTGTMAHLNGSERRRLNNLVAAVRDCRRACLSVDEGDMTQVIERLAEVGFFDGDDSRQEGARRVSMFCWRCDLCRAPHLVVGSLSEHALRMLHDHLRQMHSAVALPGTNAGSVLQYFTVEKAR